MSQQCIPVSGKNMSKVKKLLEEAKELQTREIDLVDRNIHTFEEIPGICELVIVFDDQIWIKRNIDAHLFTF